MPTNPDPDWLHTPSFQGPFSDWLKKVKAHRHVFLGYSSQAKEPALAVSAFLANKLKLSVLDWHDFRPSGVIMQNIEEAERLAMCGVFLFMADDMVKSAAARVGAPRDNVIYEAGFFAGAKGQTNTLIIRERGAKVPTDLGGVIYLELTNRGDITPIETKLSEYFAAVLPG
jgi:predicted nucleotide-binding protein